MVDGDVSCELKRFAGAAILFDKDGKCCKCITSINNGTDHMLAEAIGFNAGYKLAKLVSPSKVVLMTETDSISLLPVNKPDARWLVSLFPIKTYKGDV